MVESLNLSRCSRITPASLRTLIDNLDHLKHLDLSFATVSSVHIKVSTCTQYVTCDLMVTFFLYGESQSSNNDLIDGLPDGYVCNSVDVNNHPEESNHSSSSAKRKLSLSDSPSVLLNFCQAMSSEKWTWRLVTDEVHNNYCSLILIMILLK